jgi:hypothetical protein
MEQCNKTRGKARTRIPLGQCSWWWGCKIWVRNDRHKPEPDDQRHHPLVGVERWRAPAVCCAGVLGLCLVVATLYIQNSRQYKLILGARRLDTISCHWRCPTQNTGRHQCAALAFAFAFGTIQEASLLPCPSFGPRCHSRSKEQHTTTTTTDKTNRKHLVVSLDKTMGQRECDVATRWTEEWYVVGLLVSCSCKVTHPRKRTAVMTMTMTTSS